MKMLEQSERTNEIINTTPKKKITKHFLNYAGIALGAVLSFVVVIVLTTEIKITSLVEAVNLGAQFFILLLCSYLMYVNLMDSGMRAGLNSDVYTQTIEEYNAVKQELIDKNLQEDLGCFCQAYVEKELKNTRNAIIIDVGLSYEQYKEYIGKDEEYVGKSEFSQQQKDAIIKANQVEAIKLTPDMLIKRGRNDTARDPLGTSPQKKKIINLCFRFVKNFGVSFLMAIITFDLVAEPTRAMLAAVLMKLFSVLINGFFGYKFGYENIVVDTVDYVTDQKNLLEQSIRFAESKKSDAISVPCSVD